MVAEKNNNVILTGLDGLVAVGVRNVMLVHAQYWKPFNYLYYCWIVGWLIGQTLVIFSFTGFPSIFSVMNYHSHAHFFVFFVFFTLFSSSRVFDMTLQKSAKYINDIRFRKWSFTQPTWCERRVLLSFILFLLSANDV